MGELKHDSHEHKLILNAPAEPIIDKNADCIVCRQPVHKMLDNFYRCATTHTSSVCAGFYLHKTCAELPSTFTHPAKPQLLLSLTSFPNWKRKFWLCCVCQSAFQGSIYISHSLDFYICVKCVTFELKSREERSLCHPSHSHPLTLVQTPSLFLCHACNTAATDLSYVCTKCWFCIHQSCANAPTTYQCRFHNEHLLVLDYSLPRKYLKFPQFCGICEKNINPIHWVYYCANCRFFAHVKCASSVETSRLSGNEINDTAESNLMHFPAPDEASLIEMMQQCIMAKATSALQHNSAIVEPSPYIKHWSHKHQLALRNINTNISTPDLNQKLAHNELLICNGCTKHICSTDVTIHECNSCNYILHRSCAHFPEKIQHDLLGNLCGEPMRFYDDVFRCRCCRILSTGMAMYDGSVSFDIICASLPKKIKHEAHRHHLIQLKYPNDFWWCRACLLEYEGSDRETIIFGCEKCEFYVHTRCLLKPHKVNHRWDQHPLHLILSPKDVADHPHEYDCEFCSEDIYTNAWFYHCSVCDQSYHIDCIDPSWWNSNIKFGATYIYHKSHPCSLTFILNKKTRKCKICNLDARDKPALECSPCKFLVHDWCARN